MSKDHLNDVGLKPFLALQDHLLNIFEPFDLNPAPEVEVAESESWQGAYHNNYMLPEHLRDAADRAESLSKDRSRKTPLDQRLQVRAELEDGLVKEDSKRVHKLTTTLAWLHSRGESHNEGVLTVGVDAIMNFNIEGDAGGEDSQIQSLWFYQTSGGLPSKEYYEEKPILDLYQSVVKELLIDVASNTKASRHPSKRDLLSDLVEEFTEIDTEGWPWPWPGGDDTPKPAPSDAPGGGAQKEPLDVRMNKLATKVVHFERELVRAGADPEYLFNPHFAYNPYPSEKVDKALSFFSLPTYLSSFAPRMYPANITVTHPPYLKSVSKLVSETPDYVLSGYFTTRLAMTYSSALGPKVGVRKATRRLEEVLRGLKPGTEENRQDKCLAFVDEIVGFIAGREFVREAFSPEAKQDGEDIIKGKVFSCSIRTSKQTNFR